VSVGTSLYLDLLKRCLTRYGFEPDPARYGSEPETLYVPYATRRAGIGGRLRLAAQAAVRRRGFEIMTPVPAAPRKAGVQTLTDRELGRDWPAEAETMIGLARLNQLQAAVEDVIANDVPGDLIETGVWRGGACIFMRAVLAAHEIADRTVWVADSFEGLPKPNPSEYPVDEGDTFWTHDELSVSIDEVRANFEKYGMLDGQVRFLKGWFRDTLPAAPIDRLAVLRLDGDLYESTIQALEALYPKLSVGGYVIVDDYHVVPASRAAVTDFRSDNSIREPIVEIDGSGVYWQRAEAARVPLAE
jgi:O-methyltransferase